MELDILAYLALIPTILNLRAAAQLQSVSAADILLG